MILPNLKVLTINILAFCLINIFIFTILADSKVIGAQEEKNTKNNLCTQEITIEYINYPNFNSLERENNKFGIYIYAEVDKFFDLAQDLVNSNQGEWGYVLIPFNIKDQNKSKWKKVFAKLYEKKLIPIIQLWDVNPHNYKKDTKNAAKFLNSLIWPIKERYISVYNEPNDSRFWKGKADPKNYAEVLDFTIDTFKSENPNFFMLNGGLNSSAPNKNGYIDIFTFLYEMNKAKPNIFNKLDGWASHPYPQPNFSASPYNSGIMSIRSYENEISYLKSLGLNKNLPVFITETGWAHAEGEDYNYSYHNQKQVARFFKIAFEEVWLKDPNVKAVTPFTIYYKPPYDHFSWVNKNYEPYEQFEVVKSLPKIKGEPAFYTIEKINLTTCN